MSVGYLLPVIEGSIGLKYKIEFLEAFGRGSESRLASGYLHFVQVPSGFGGTWGKSGMKILAPR